MSLKILHTADWHLRNRQYGRNFRRKDFAMAVEDVLHIAADNKCDCIINGGDTFDNNRPSEEMLDILFKTHHRLLEMGIPMFVVTGNHDASDPSYLKFPDYTGGNPAGVVCIDHKVVEFKGLVIAGFPASAEPDHVRTRVAGIADEKGGVDIVVWHGAVEDFVPFPMANSWSMAEMPTECARAWLLGDIHLPGRKRLDDGAIVSYPGPIELCERGEPAVKHVDLYTLEDGWRDKQFPDPVEITIDTRPVVFLTAADDAQADQCLQRIREEIRNSPERGPLVFLRYERSQKGLVNRITDELDLSDSVFMAASFQNEMDLSVFGAANSSFAPPELADVAAEEIPSGHPLHDLTKRLVERNANPVAEVAKWVDGQISMRTEAEELSAKWAACPDEDSRKVMKTEDLQRVERAVFDLAVELFEQAQAAA